MNRPDETGSGEVPPELLTKAGKHPVLLKVMSDGKRIELCRIEVTP